MGSLCLTTTLHAGWCQITCGRCSCCEPVAKVAQDQGLTSLLAAVQTAGLSSQFNAPASQFTLLAPTDAAFTAALPALGQNPPFVLASNSSILQCQALMSAQQHITHLFTYC